ncbi:MAG: hypothetical protein M3145_08490 [Pseudomonadota bacterium]|nr:hypothetical protein [Pseudomonadota bacterium]
MAAAFAASVSLAAADVQREIRFARGASSATVAGAVVRGDRDIYPVKANAGQTMRVRITAIENNAAFEIYRPGARYRRDQDGYEVMGSTLKGAGQTDDAKQWSGTLPATGTYLIVVGGTRGNAGYRMTVSIR